MRLINYLPTRTFELTVHTCDLAAALGQVVEVPETSAVESLNLLGELAVRTGRAAPAPGGDRARQSARRVHGLVAVEDRPTGQGRSSGRRGALALGAVP